MVSIIVEHALRSKLLDELVNGELEPLSVESLEGNNPVGAKIVFQEGTNMELVQQIVNAHDPTPLPEPPTKEELLQQEIDELKAVVDAMLNGGDA